MALSVKAFGPEGQMPSRSGPFFISILAVSLLPVACRSRRALLSPRASRVVSFMAGFCLHASCVSCVAAPSRPRLPHQGPARSGSAGWLVQGANPAPDGKALATRGGWDKPTNDPCILSGGTTAQSTYMHDTAQHMSELLETLHGGLPPDNARPGLD